MALIKSISGIRGTIGGHINDNLTPVDVVKFAAAYGMWLKTQTTKEKLTVIIGRDARISGEMVSNLVSNTLIGLGINVTNIGLSTTPTVEVAVMLDKVDGGIVITASHNPKQWNALKLLNNKGEFLNAKAGTEVLNIVENNLYEFAHVDDLGTYSVGKNYIERHIEEVLKLKLVDVQAIKNAKFKVVLDAVNSTGGITIPALLKKLGVACIELYCEPNGIVVDPDVDRLALINEDGSMFGEEYTLVACADYVLGNTKGNTVSNLSSPRGLRDVTEKHGCKYHASAVGEVNVVELMKSTNTIIGGEGNGGIIYPEAHYGRDALVGVALFLSHLAKSKMSCKELRDGYTSYFSSKNKIELTTQIDVDKILETIANNYKNEEVNAIDGVKIDFENEWVHMRKSNTETIIRIYTEGKSKQKANDLAERFINEIEAVK